MRLSFTIRDWLTLVVALMAGWWINIQHEQRLFHDYDEVLSKYRQQLQEAQAVISQQRDVIGSLQGGGYQDIIPSR